MKFLETLAQQFAGKPIDWDELEHALIRADLGGPLTTRIIKKLQEREAWSLLGISDVIKTAREEIGKILPDETKPIEPLSGKPNVILIVGVNGNGKTTSGAIVQSSTRTPRLDRDQTRRQRQRRHRRRDSGRTENSDALHRHRRKHRRLRAI